MFVLVMMVFVVFGLAPRRNTLWITARAGEVVRIETGVVFVGLIAFVTAAAQEVTHARITGVPVQMPP